MGIVEKVLILTEKEGPVQNIFLVETHQFL